MPRGEVPPPPTLLPTPPQTPAPNLATLVVPAQAKKDVEAPPIPVVPPKNSALGPAKPAQDLYESYIRLEAPGRERLFGTRDTEHELEERMRQERRDVGDRDPIVFPEKPVITTEKFEQRQFAPMIAVAEPNYIVYRPLYFQDKNSERFGWELGSIQPLVSTLVFFKDVALWPAHFAAYPCRRFDTNAGQCLPGDPVPYLCYPPELTGSGLLAEVGVIGLVFLAVP